MKPLLTDPLGLLAALPRHGEAVELRFGRTPTYVVCSPEAAQRVLRNSDHAFDKGGVFYENMRSIVGDGMATCPPARHKRLRRLAQPAFHTGRMTGYVHTIHAQVHAVTATWRHGQLLDVLPEMRSLATRSNLATMFCRRDLGPEVAGLRQAVTDFVDLPPSATPGPCTSSPRTPRWTPKWPTKRRPSPGSTRGTPPPT